MRVLHVVRSDAFAGVESHVACLARAQAEMAGHLNDFEAAGRV